MLELYVIQNDGLWFQMAHRASRPEWWGAPLHINPILVTLEAGPNVSIEHMPASNFLRMAQEYTRANGADFFGPEHTVHNEPLMMYPAFGVGKDHVAVYNDDDDGNPRVQTLRLPTYEHPYFGGIYKPSFDTAQVSVAIDYIQENGFGGPLPLLDRIVVL